jgi:hypothetical protein
MDSSAYRKNMFDQLFILPTKSTLTSYYRWTGIEGSGFTEDIWLVTAMATWLDVGVILLHQRTYQVMRVPLQ